MNISSAHGGEKSQLSPPYRRPGVFLRVGITLVVLTFSLILSGASQASLIASTDFESYPLGNISSSATPFYGFNGAGGQVTNNPTPFGPNNQFVKLDASLGTGGAGINTVLSLTTYKFDIYEPNSGQSGIYRFGLTANDLNNTAYICWGIDDGVITASFNTGLASGTAPTLTLDTRYTAYVLFNDSGSIQAINGSGGANINDNEAALFIYNPGTGIMTDGGRFTNNLTGSAPTRFIFRSFTGGANNNQIYLDNFSVDNTLVVPEPTTIALLGMGSLALLAGAGVRRRRKTAKRDR